MTVVSEEVPTVHDLEGRAPPTGSHWPVNWTAIWVGALSAMAVALVFSLVGAALGAHQLGPAGRIAKWSDIGFGALALRFADRERDRHRPTHTASRTV